MSCCTPEESRSSSSIGVRRLLKSLSPWRGKRLNSMRRVCSTERYSVMSRRFSAQVSTTCVPKLLTRRIASPAVSTTAPPLPPAISVRWDWGMSSSLRGRERQRRRILDHFQRQAGFYIFHPRHLQEDV